MMTRYAVPARQRPVGWYLRDYRESAGYDLADAARVLGCNRSKISRIETGQRGIPPKELRELLAGSAPRRPGARVRAVTSGSMSTVVTQPLAGAQQPGSPRRAA